MFPKLVHSLQRAMKPLYSKDKVGMESRPITTNGVTSGQNGCVDEDLIDSGDDLLFPDGC